MHEAEEAALTVSMGYLCLRAKFCSVPVRNACGKKNPEIQYTDGVPCSTQRDTKCSRSSKSATQDESGLSEGYALASHSAGT
jgi:hypothetical protein